MNGHLNNVWPKSWWPWSLKVLLSVPCVETMAAARATKVARWKRGSQQKILESADLTTLLNSSFSQASIAKKLGVYASTLSYYLKKRRREHEGGAKIAYK